MCDRCEASDITDQTSSDKTDRWMSRRNTQNSQLRRESMIHKPDLSLDANMCLGLHCDQCEGVIDEMFVHQSTVSLLVMFISQYVMNRSWTHLLGQKVKHVLEQT